MLHRPQDHAHQVAIEAERTLADALPILVMISDASGAVQFFNRGWHELTGQPSMGAGSLGDWRAYMHPDDGAGVEAAWHEAVARGDRVIRMRYRLRDQARGEYRWFSAQAVAIEDDLGRIVQWIGAAVDVDDEVAARAQLERLLQAQKRVAERYQLASLPDRLPVIPGVRFHTRYRPSTKAMLVGGDWYDVFELPDGQVAISIGDVAGHGLGAAVVMNKIRHSARAVARWVGHSDAVDPAGILEAMEQALETENAELIATAVFGVLDLRARTLRYASAGHPPPLFRHRDGVIDEGGAVGTPLGARFGIAREVTQLSLETVEAVILYTDGVIEGERDALAGIERLRNAVSRVNVRRGGNIARFILEQAQATDLDDAAVLVAELR
jgi:PAS domain S-box-containing protein